MARFQRARDLVRVLVILGLASSVVAQQPNEAKIPDPPFPTAPLTICPDGMLASCAVSAAPLESLTKSSPHLLQQTNTGILLVEQFSSTCGIHFAYAIFHYYAFQRSLGFLVLSHVWGSWNQAYSKL